jgi:hypothetical protein
MYIKINAVQRQKTEQDARICVLILMINALDIIMLFNLFILLLINLIIHSSYFLLYYFNSLLIANWKLFFSYIFICLYLKELT